MKSIISYGFPGSVKDQAYRQRRAKRPNLPTTLEEVDIYAYPDLVTTTRGKPFYRGKTKTTAVELWMSDVQVDILTTAVSVNIDCTFGIVPIPHNQVAFVNARVGENVYCVATALLPNKDGKTYLELLQKIRDVCRESGKEIDLVYVHSDCERAIINAIQAVFPTAQVRLCRFHVLDAIRKWGNLHGLRPIIKGRDDFKKFWYRLFQIFHFRPDDYPLVFRQITAQLGRETRALPLVQNFLDYVVRSWVPDRLPIRPKSCLHHPSMTTCFQSDSGTLTNNDAETYNYRMKKVLGDHPSLPKFMKAIQRENAVTEGQWLQKDRPKSSKGRRVEDRERFERRKDWEATLEEARNGHDNNRIPD